MSGINCRLIVYILVALICLRAFRQLSRKGRQDTLRFIHVDCIRFVSLCSWMAIWLNLVASRSVLGCGPKART